MDKSASRIGFWSAIIATLLVIIFAFALIVSLQFPSAVMVSFVSSLFLAPTFIVLMISINSHVPENKKIWSQIGLGFAVVYAAMVSINYYVQLVVVRTNSLNVSADALALFEFVPGSVMFAIDMLGYGFLCLATLFAAPIFVAGRLERSIRWLFVANGVLVFPTLLFPAIPMSPGDTGDLMGTLALLVWCVIFAPTTALLSMWFKRILLVANLS